MTNKVKHIRNYAKVRKMILGHYAKERKDAAKGKGPKPARKPVVPR